MHKITYKKLVLLIILLTILMLSLLSYNNANKKKFENKLSNINNMSIAEQPFAIKSYINNNNKAERTIIVSHFTINNNNFIMSVIKNHRKYAKKHGYDYWFRNGIIEPNFSNKQKKHINDPVVFWGLHWQKPAAIKQAMDIMDGRKHKYDWILWLDGDAVFTNFNKSLENLKKEINVTENQFLIIARDMSCDEHNICPYNCCLNAGVLLIRNNTKGRQFIQNIIDSFTIYKNNLPVPEQAAFQDQIFGLIVRKNDKIQAFQYTGKNKCDLSAIPGVMLIDNTIMNSQYMNSKYNKNWKSGQFIAHFVGLANAPRGEKIIKFLKCINSNRNNNFKNCENDSLN